MPRQPYWTLESRPRIEAPTTGDIGVMLDPIHGAVILLRFPALGQDVILDLEMADELIRGVTIAIGEAEKMLSGELQPPAAHA